MHPRLEAGRYVALRLDRGDEDRGEVAQAAVEPRTLLLVRERLLDFLDWSQSAPPQSAVGAGGAKIPDRLVTLLVLLQRLAGFYVSADGTPIEGGCQASP